VHIPKKGIILKITSITIKEIILPNRFISKNETETLRNWQKRGQIMIELHPAWIPPNFLGIGIKGEGATPSKQRTQMFPRIHHRRKKKN
jgi:hypothetical protein